MWYICEKFFTLKQNLKIHIKNVHKGMRNTSQNTNLITVILVENSSLNWENGRNTSRKFILNRNTNLIFHLKFYPNQMFLLAFPISNQWISAFRHRIFFFSIMNILDQVKVFCKSFEVFTTRERCHREFGRPAVP